MFIGFTAGFGLIVIVTVNGVPVQDPLTGVTLYNATLTELVVFTRVPLMVAVPLPEAPPVNPAPVGEAQL
jgi:hypothetical protein